MSDYQGGPFQPSPPGMTPPQPPGMTPPPPPSQYGPEPIEPGGQSSAWKYLLIGCAVVAIIAVLAFAGIGMFIAKSGKNIFSDLISSGFEMGKPEYMKMLTPEHTEEQKNEFSRHYDLLGERISEDGIIKFSTEYGEVFQEFSEISRDGKITVKESADWVENFDQALSSE